MADQDSTRARRAGAIRSSDLEPYTGLRWVATLFKAAAVFIFVALAAEFVAGIRLAGTGALSTLLAETARTAVLAVVLWGGGDLVRLLVDIGHDLRAQRVLMVRLLSRTPKQLPGVEGEIDEEAEELNIHPGTLREPPDDGGGGPLPAA
jgi:hypothetical protein